MGRAKLTPEFFARASTEVAPDLLGREIQKQGELYIITETAAFEGGIEGRKPEHLEGLSMAPGVIYPHFAFGYVFAINTDAKDTPSVVTILGMQDQNDQLYKTREVSKLLGINKHSRGNMINASGSEFQLLKTKTIDTLDAIKDYRPANAPQNLVSQYKIQLVNQ